MWFLQKKKESVTDTTSLYRASLLRLEEEYDQNKATLRETFQNKLKSLLTFKEKEIDELQQKMADINQELNNQSNEVAIIYSELDKLNN